MESLNLTKKLRRIAFGVFYAFSTTESSELPSGIYSTVPQFVEISLD
jgi:hypothetical protein